jgi:alpha-amylase
MKKLCFYFQVHQPFRLRHYRFFDIGNSDQYFDEHKNRSVMHKVAEKCYIPANNILLDLIREYGNRFKISFSISGTALDQFELYAPEVLKSFQELAKTDCVEFLSETYSHSLSSLISSEEFNRQVKDHAKKTEQLFGKKPTVFRNTELIYSDKIGELVSNMGFKTMLTEGADQILGWKSPNFLYCGAANPQLKLLLKNYRLSDDIAFRFSQSDGNGTPLTAEKFVSWLNAIPANDEIINLFMDYETFGEHQWKESGIFEFMRALPHHVFSSSNYSFVTPSEAANACQPIALLSMPNPVSWADEERDLSAWLGNDIQDDAFESLYRLENKINKTKNPDLLRDWRYLQTSDHFYYMCTKFFADGDVHKYFNPYNSPYEAFINYMNVLSDFEERVNGHINLTIEKSQKRRVIPIPKKSREVQLIN